MTDYHKYEDEQGLRAETGVSAYRRTTAYHRHEVHIPCPNPACRSGIIHRLEDPIRHPAPAVGSVISCPGCAQLMLVAQEGVA